MSCNTCGKATSVVCNHFDVDGSIAPAARYCSKACQAVDWPTHKEECNKSKHRKQLYARGQFLQKVCYLFRKGSFEQSYDRVEKDSTGKLHIHDSTEDLDKFLFPFPHHLNLSLQDKQAVLCHLAFDEIAQLSRLLERLIKGHYTQLYEQTVSIKASHQRIVAHKLIGVFEGFTFVHKAFAVALKDGHKYIIAGAQYGQYQAVMSVTAFHSGWVDSVDVPQQPLGGHREDLRLLLEKSDICGLSQDLRAAIVQGKITAKLEALVKTWEQARRSQSGSSSDNRHPLRSIRRTSCSPFYASYSRRLSSDSWQTAVSHSNA